ncbi:transposase [Cupriavidus sp. AcVe19-6a]|uniref:transposase n=1 Tax=Cupriavidus sp. AcVe19-6a TaxID=2821358 RepID=UPI001FD7B19B|nr:transposase [Cupriavidus sp. AcVe19-6a]
MKETPSVCHALLQTPAFFSLLRRIDEDLMQAARENCCCHCGQPLHRADYPRKPRGCPPAARPDCSTRLSLCCTGCRKRTTPGSVRFLGRRVYLAIITVLRSSRAHCFSIEGLPSVSWVTLKRWRLWWDDTFPTTPIGRWLNGRLPLAPEPVAYPERLLQSVQADTDAGRFTAALRLLLPPL